MSGLLLIMCLVPLAIGPTSWAPGNMGFANEKYFVRSEFNILTPVVFRALLRTSIRNSRIYCIIAAIVMVCATFQRLRYSQTLQLAPDIEKTVVAALDKEEVDGYLRANLASFVASLWIEGCTLCRLFYLCYVTSTRRGVHLYRWDRLSLPLLLLGFNSFFVLHTISARVVAIFSSLNNDTSLYVYWLLAAATTVTRVFAQGVILSSSTMRTNKELSSVLWLNNAVMLVQFMLLAQGYPFNRHMLPQEFTKLSPSLLDCMVVVDFLFRVGTTVSLCFFAYKNAGVRDAGPQLQNGGPAAIVQGNGPDCSIPSVAQSIQEESENANASNAALMSHGGVFFYQCGSEQIAAPIVSAVPVVKQMDRMVFTEHKYRPPPIDAHGPSDLVFNTPPSTRLRFSQSPVTSGKPDELVLPHPKNQCCTQLADLSELCMPPYVKPFSEVANLHM